LAKEAILACSPFPLPEQQSRADYLEDHPSDTKQALWGRAPALLLILNKPLDHSALVHGLHVVRKSSRDPGSVRRITFVDIPDHVDEFLLGEIAEGFVC
jgi:hypothetical protein